MNNSISFYDILPQQMQSSTPMDYTENHRLSEQVKFELYRALLDCPYPEGEAMETAIERARDVISTHLPCEIKAVLREMRTGLNPPGRLQITNWPVDTLPPTRLSGRRNPEKTTYVSENALLGITSILGEPYGGLEKPDTLVHDVTSVPGALQQTNEGTKVLGIHTELAGMATPPHWLGFAGLRADPGKQALTAFADIRNALDWLDEPTVSALYAEEFETSVPLKLQREGGANTRLHAVLSGPRRIPELRVALYGNLTRGTTPRARNALKRLHQALQRCAENVLQDAGSLVVVNNRLQVHARAGEFETTGMGDDRWFQRVHVAASLWDLRELQEKHRRVFNA